MAEVNTKIFGTGWSFPPTFSSDLATIQLVSGVEDINESLHILLSTSLGERVKREDFGARLDSFIFEPANTGSLAAMKNLVEKAIVQNEPRIALDDILLFSDANEGLIEIDIRYTILTTNTRNNFVFPFYLKEGINL